LLVFTIDHRSEATIVVYEVCKVIIYRRTGVNEMKDQLKGVEFLKSLPYVDTNRIGVYGWSYWRFYDNFVGLQLIRMSSKLVLPEVR